jgi:hypothetical protein
MAGSARRFVQCRQCRRRPSEVAAAVTRRDATRARAWFGHGNPADSQGETSRVHAGKKGTSAAARSHRWMTSNTRRISDSTRSTSVFWRPIAAAASIALFIALLIGALTLSMVIVAGFALRALLGGRRPGPVNLHWGSAPIARARRHAPAGEVVDVQAREIEMPPSR